MCDLEVQNKRGAFFGGARVDVFCTDICDIQVKRNKSLLLFWLFARCLRCTSCIYIRRFVHNLTVLVIKIVNKITM